MHELSTVRRVSNSHTHARTLIDSTHEYSVSMKISVRLSQRISRKLPFRSYRELMWAGSCFDGAPNEIRHTSCNHVIVIAMICSKFIFAQFHGFNAHQCFKRKSKSNIIQMFKWIPDNFRNLKMWCTPSTKRGKRVPHFVSITGVYWYLAKRVWHQFSFKATSVLHADDRVDSVRSVYSART